MMMENVLQAATLVKKQSEHDCSTANTTVDVQELLQWFAPSWFDTAQSSL
jgi:hypothetical protein